MKAITTTLILAAAVAVTSCSSDPGAFSTACGQTTSQEYWPSLGSADSTTVFPNERAGRTAVADSQLSCNPRT